MAQLCIVLLYECDYLLLIRKSSSDLVFFWNFAPFDLSLECDGASEVISKVVP